MKTKEPELLYQEECRQCVRTEPLQMDRIVDKLNRYMEKKEYEAAEHHLRYWLADAQLEGDRRAELSLQNESMGFYRKMGRGEEAVQAAEATLALVDELQLQGSITGGTCCVNAGTVFHAFGNENRAIALFDRALPLYQRYLKEDDSRLGSLFNNMALCYVALKRYGEGYRAYERALEVMPRIPGGSLEEAITYLNMANAVEQEHGLEKAEKKIEQYLDKAEDLLRQGRDTNEPGYYAFVLEKCAPTFRYYGYFLTAKELEQQAAAIIAAL